jgi:hypothetical protein
MQGLTVDGELVNAEGAVPPQLEELTEVRNVGVLDES